ncbi:MAG: GNAT family N-acetyltransferase [Bacteroidota bacterium]
MSSTIRFLKRRQIDEKAWNKRVSDADLAPLYSFTWYLDAATNGRWDAVVYGDYDYLLPLPINLRWFGLPRVVTPPLCQQLGVLTSPADLTSPTNISVAKNRLGAILEAIPKRYWQVRLQLKLPAILGELKGLRSRTNLCIDLSKQTYQDLSNNYSKSLKKRIRRAATQYRILANDDVGALVDMYQREVGTKANLKSWTYRNIAAIINECTARGYGQNWSVVHADGTVHAMGFFAGQDRIINLFGASNDAGRAGFAMHFMLDHVIKESIGSGASLFDFEGSEIPGVQAFFQSFGPYEEPYWVYQR